MSLSNGLIRLGRSTDRRKRAGQLIRPLTLENPADWRTGERAWGMSRDRAMKISTVNRCVEVLSNSMGVLPLYIMAEGSKKRMDDHRLGRVLWGRANEAMTSFDYNRLMLCNQILRDPAGQRLRLDRPGLRHRLSERAYPAAARLCDHPL